MAEIEGVDRFVADVIEVPEERRGLYMDGGDLKMAKGRIIEDREVESNGAEERLVEMEREFMRQFN